AEDTNHMITVEKWHRADLHRNPTAVGVDQDEPRVRHLRRPQDLAGEELSGPPRLLVRDHAGELPPHDIAHDVPGRQVDPADDTVAVDDVAGHVDVLQHLLHLHRPQCLDRHRYPALLSLARFDYDARGAPR